LSSLTPYAVIFSTAICFMLWSSPFPLLPLLTRAFALSESQAGLLASLFALPGFFVSIPAGWLLDRYPNAPILAASWLLAAVGVLLMAVAPSYWLLCAGRLILATGLGVHLVGAPRLLSVWFRGSRYLGFSMALYSWAFTVGVFLGLTYLSRVAVRFGWRAPLFLLVGLSVLALVSMWIAAAGTRPAHSSEGNGASRHAFNFLQLGASAWIAAAVYLFYSAGTDAYYTYSPSYLVTRGYALAQASGMVGFYAWFALFLKPVFATFLTRKTAALMVVAGSLSAIAGYALLTSGLVSPYLSSALIGVSIALSMPALFALPAFLLPSRLAGMGYGLLALFLSTELFTTPLVGYTVDRTHSYHLAYLVMSAYLLIALAGALYLHARLRQQRHASDPK
jgi:predicted MFS family arabinose efflux permease